MKLEDSEIIRFFNREKRCCISCSNNVSKVRSTLSSRPLERDEYREVRQVFDYHNATSRFWFTA